MPCRDYFAKCQKVRLLNLRIPRSETYWLNFKSCLKWSDTIFDGIWSSLSLSTPSFTINCAGFYTGLTILSFMNSNYIVLNGLVFNWLPLLKSLWIPCKLSFLPPSHALSTLFTFTVLSFTTVFKLIKAPLKTII